MKVEVKDRFFAPSNLRAIQANRSIQGSMDRITTGESICSAFSIDPLS